MGLVLRQGTHPVARALDQLDGESPRGRGQSGAWLAEKGKEIRDGRVKRPSCSKSPEGTGAVEGRGAGAKTRIAHGASSALGSSLYFP